jgi:hypothetical protein
MGLIDFHDWTPLQSNFAIRHACRCDCQYYNAVHRYGIVASHCLGSQSTVEIMDLSEQGTLVSLYCNNG